MRIEHWTNAAEQGLHAARSLLAGDAAEPFTAVPYVWSDQYDVKIQCAGRFGGDDRIEFVHGTARGRPLRRDLRASRSHQRRPRVLAAPPRDRSTAADRGPRPVRRGRSRSRPRIPEVASRPGRVSSRPSSCWSRSRARCTSSRSARSIAVLPLFARHDFGADDIGVGIAVGAFAFGAVRAPPVRRPASATGAGRRLLVIGGARVVCVSMALYLTATGLPALIALSSPRWRRRGRVLRRRRDDDHRPRARSSGGARRSRTGRSRCTAGSRSGPRSARRCTRPGGSTRCGSSPRPAPASRRLLAMFTRETRPDVTPAEGSAAAAPGRDHPGHHDVPGADPARRLHRVPQAVRRDRRASRTSAASSSSTAAWSS